MKITIFGMAGTGTSSTGKKLAEDLGYDFASGGSMAREVAKELGVELNVLEELSKTDSKYDILRDEHLKKFGREHENCVIEARLGWWAVPDSFKVKLRCSDEVCISRIMARENKTYEQVEKETREREESIKQRFKSYYNMDFEKETEDSNFDLVIDTGQSNLNEVVNLIKEKMGVSFSIQSPHTTYLENINSQKKNKLKEFFFSFVQVISLLAIIIVTAIVAFDFWKENISKNPLNDAEKQIRNAANLPKIEIDSPADWEVVNSPVKISGRAEDSWFSESQFNVSLLDQNGKVLKQGVAYAKDDFVAGGMIPFESEIEFEKPLSQKGFLVFLRKNSSGDGLPQEFKIQVLFE